MWIVRFCTYWLLFCFRKYRKNCSFYRTAEQKLLELQTECDWLRKKVELNENGLTEALEQKKQLIDETTSQKETISRLRLENDNVTREYEKCVQDRGTLLVAIEDLKVCLFSRINVENTSISVFNRNIQWRHPIWWLKWYHRDQLRSVNNHIVGKHYRNLKSLLFFRTDGVCMLKFLPETVVLNFFGSYRRRSFVIYSKRCT